MMTVGMYDIGLIFSFYGIVELKFYNIEVF